MFFLKFFQQMDPTYSEIGSANVPSQDTIGLYGSLVLRRILLVCMVVLSFAGYYWSVWWSYPKTGGFLYNLFIAYEYLLVL